MTIFSEILSQANHELGATIMSGMGALFLGTAIDASFPFTDEPSVKTDLINFAGHLGGTALAVLLWRELCGDKFDSQCSGGVFFTVLLTAQPSMVLRIKNLNTEIKEELLSPWNSFIQGNPLMALMKNINPNTANGKVQPPEVNVSGGK
jgi:hypothetical protein